MVMRFIAYTVKGLESVAEAEIRHLIRDVEVIEVGTKRIIFETAAFQRLASLRVVDDLGFLLGRARIEDLLEVLQFTSNLDLLAARQSVAQLRQVDDHSFSITATLRRDNWP
jgi:23S rRNA G2445 N2-methylase RlmL